LLDVTDVGVMLRRGSIEGHDPRRGRIGAHYTTKLMRTAVTGPGFCSYSATYLSGSPRAESSAGYEAAMRTGQPRATRLRA
jgi:hypothetical protein